MSREVCSISAPVCTDFPSKFGSKNPTSDAFHLASLDPVLIPGGPGGPEGPGGPGAYGGPSGPGGPGGTGALKFRFGGGGPVGP